ncbi:MAG: PTS transporter subunit EIIC [Bifidobacteriaceae bacterium]|jgi:PTS system cellobiose-specific IIC component|nr:PTS transporter subunit EIIC [Bifidobacteriaceae bacterium]
MNKFLRWMDRSVAPKMDRINQVVMIQTLKDSMMQILPLVLVGSLVTIFAILQEYIPGMPDLYVLSNYTIGLVGLIIAFLIPFNYIERKKLHALRLVAGMTSVGMFAMVVHLDNAEIFEYSALGAGGMFVAIIVGIIASIVFRLFCNFSFFGKDSQMPDFVRQWFDNMLPILLLVGGSWVITSLLGLDVFALINQALSPLTTFAQTFWGFTILYFLACFFYTMGISTWMLYSITFPIMLEAITANSEAVASGGPAANIFTSEVIYSGWLGIGGTGATLILCIMMLFAKSTRLKAIARASVFPGILNINEPIVFGAIAWNPLLMIPMWISGLITPMVVYGWLSFGWAAIPNSVMQVWYMPFPVSTWIVSPSVGGLILLAVVIALNFLIYYPFFKVYDTQQAKAERDELALESESMEKSTSNVM